MVEQGLEAGYGHWLEPIANVEDPNSNPSSQDPSAASEAGLALERRGRGRPRVSKARDQSAVEKRRAQVRNAQRTYQKRKESAAASVNQRCDDLLQVLSDLSTDVEELLQVALKDGALDQKDDIGAQLRRLWESYDVVIHSSCVRPELRLLQIKNDRRRAGYEGKAPTTEVSSDHETAPRPEPFSASDSHDPSFMDLDLGRTQESTLIQPFRMTSSLHHGKTIFEVISERQAEFRSSASHSS
ncbi:uncharacterized protein BDR25DRAFT_319289 [Lindgomyces ingoldianus]|uniref:Uncharacterized protein n=1 Tax=Lindgomyces ingoldianus TaxID=673940 RepID=A0ACB6QB64_9PLEO|nr:uncharacterized protein BDR25DRAFT_319289 [Lindgomyces ingoldianus]KAF2464209.1 hypothetical protein BDR25DRAFT_319289 [Lindgomyces ingoldianus]